MTIVIHHNPNCGTSRNVLALIKATGIEPIVIEYLKTGWTRPQLQALFAAANLGPRDALRIGKSPAEELGLSDQSVSDEAILDAMLEHPVLVNRPIVATARGVRLCRPTSAVLDILPVAPKGPVLKDDGAVIMDAEGNLHV